MAYLCVTTTAGSDWRKQIRDLDRFGEDTASVFPTCLNLKKRKELYGLLLASGVKNIPHVHLRDDMSEKEAEFFIENFGTRAFTIHPDRLEKFSKWKIARQLFMELQYRNLEFDLDKLESIGGFCVDLAHFTRARDKKTAEYGLLLEGIRKYKVGCNHIGGILADGRDSHFIHNPANFNYLKKIPAEMFSSCPCLEVENSIAKQRQYRDYIVKMNLRGLK